MAKFKVGDRVEEIHAGVRYVGTVVALPVGKLKRFAGHVAVAQDGSFKCWPTWINERYLVLIENENCPSGEK